MNQYEVTEELRNIIANNMQYTTWTVSTPHLVALVNKCIEAEREACAKVCDEKVNAEYATGKVDHNEMGWTQACAIEIRARGETK